MRLSDLLVRSPRAGSEHHAIEDPSRGTAISYKQLRSAAESVCEILTACGVQDGDRVGICAPKSIGTVGSIFGVIDAGAAYVPVDPTAPALRSAAIFADCAVRAIVAERSLAAELKQELGIADNTDRGLAMLDTYGTELVVVPVPEASTDPAAREQTLPDLAYILYTSGSTGKPKGVMHTHASALSFVDWCSEVFEPQAEDRISSHAPFHFDLSIHDLYVPIKHGATMVLIGEDVGKIPRQLAQLIHDAKVSIWYSTPSVLRTLVEYGELDAVTWPHLRIVLFAGEVFPIKYFQRLRAVWTAPRYFNLYGPTETNVCTFYSVPEEVPKDQTAPFPIGVTCSSDRAKVVDTDGSEVEDGEAGELLVTGGTVMQGYWNQASRAAEWFVVDEEGIRWYKTGDIVKRSKDGSFEFIGRRDRMVKRRGYRIELGEIEAALNSHPGVVEAAAVAVTDCDGDVRIEAFLYGQKVSQVEIKGWCAQRIPLYMVPDRITLHQEPLAKTSTDKIDYQALKTLA